MTRLKYGNKITEVDGIKFRSLGEALRYKELKLMQKAGEISDLRLQTKHILYVGGCHVGTYTSDFEYVEEPFYIIEDFKGVRTALFTLKWNIMKAMFSVERVEQRHVVFKLTGAPSKSKRVSLHRTSVSRRS